MATEKQIAANRRNAALSTGPRSAGGRARSSRNAMRHGLTSRRDWHADEANWFRLVAAIEEATSGCELNPSDHGAIENLAAALMHLKRVKDACTSVMTEQEGHVGSFAQPTLTIKCYERYLADADRGVRTAEALLAPLITK